jgi:hypothetical protein
VKVPRTDRGVERLRIAVFLFADSITGCMRRRVLVASPAAGAAMSEVGHFQTKSEALSLRIFWSHPPVGADVLHLAFVLNNALGSPACFQGHRRLLVGNVPTEAAGKSLRVFRLRKAEYDEGKAPLLNSSIGLNKCGASGAPILCHSFHAPDQKPLRM